MRVAFLGNHTVGVLALAAIAETEEVAAVVAHPPDPEDGVRYASVHDYAAERDWSVRRLTGRDPELARFLRDAQPDLLWITDYRYLIGPDALAAAPLGAVNLHPSLLPRYRGRAPLNWAILEGESEVGLTAHFVDEGVDSGDVIAQRRLWLSSDEDVGDALERLYPLYEDLTRAVMAMFRRGDVPRMSQDLSGSRVYPARRPEDGRIDWSEPAVRVRDLVRAVARPYPGAFTECDGRILRIWRARLGDAPPADPGTVVEVGDDGPVVACGASGVVLLETEWEDGARSPGDLSGKRLG